MLVFKEKRRISCVLSLIFIKLTVPFLNLSTLLKIACTCLECAGMRSGYSTRLQLWPCGLSSRLCVQ